MFSIPWSDFFLDPSRTAWLWILVPFFLLYLIRPKPINQTIPSLMFLMQDKGNAVKNSFFRYLYRDFVFLLQLITLVLLVAAAMQPFISVEKTALVGNSVIVLDASASMQTKDGRWDDALTAANDAITRQNTIILIKNRPVVIGKDVSSAEAKDLLDNLEPSDTETNLYAGIVAARQYAQGVDSVVTIISDFRETDTQQDYKAAIHAVATTGAAVQVKPVGTQDVKNAGFVSMDIDDSKTRLGVKNYRTESIVVTVKAGSLSQDVPLGPGATDYVTFQTPPGITKVTLTPSDDFDLDNTVVIANEEKFAYKVLIITNDANIKTTPLYYALQSISETTPVKLTIDINTPPALTTVDHDLVIVAKVDPHVLVQRTLRDAAASVSEKGRAAIIIEQVDSFSLNYEGLLPLEYQSQGTATGVTRSGQSSLVQGIEFGDVSQYTLVKPAGTTLAVATTDNTPIISLVPVGKGQVLAYGITDDKGSFALEPTYPVFWKRMIDALTGRVGADKRNTQTGATPIGVAGTPTKMPDAIEGSYTGFLDAQGAYTFPDRVVSANLLSIEESDIAAPTAESITAETGLASVESQRKEKELTGLFALVALILLFLELFIVKYRGDF